MNRKRISVDLGDQHDAWFLLAQKYNQRPSTMAREALISILVGEKASSPEITKEIKKNCHSDRESKVRQEISLRDDEAAALDRYAKKIGVNRHQAIIYIIREFVANEVHFSDEETTELAISNSNLRKISTNLNQMAKKINSLAQDEVKYRDLKSLTAQVGSQCKELKRQVKLHCQTVWTLINTARNRGKIDK